MTSARPSAVGSVRDLALYFLRLGALGFGGPIALAGRMREDLVDARGWFTESEYKEGLALAQLCPGPLAAQLAMYLGWLRGGAAGAAVIGGAFIAPSLFLVIVLATLFVSGVTAAAAGAIAGAAVVLGRRALVDVTTVLLAVGTLAALLRWKRIPEPIWVLAAGAVGLLAHYLGSVS